MNFNSFRSHSIKTRVTLFTLGIFLVSIWLLAFYANRVLRADMQHLLGDQQLSTATFVAANLNDEMSRRIAALELLARRITPALLTDQATLQTMLGDRQADYSLFNNGIAAVGVDGTVIAEYPPSPGRLGTNFMERDYVIGPLKEGKMTIGRPVMSKLMHAPTFVIGVPIRDPQGKVIGVLGGVTDLRLPNFLDHITQGHYGKTGGYLLVAPQHRLIVTATDKRRVMEVLPAPGIDPLVDQRVRGQEGTEVFINPRGVQVMSSSKSVPVAGWFLVVSLPTEEAFAPIRDVQQHLLLATLFLTLLAGALTWWMLQRQLAPMLATVKTLTRLSGSGQPVPPLPITRHDEIGELIGGFNHLLAELGQREALLKQVMDTSNAAIYLLDQEGRIVQANQRMAEMFGCSVSALIGSEMLALVHPTQREDGRQKMQALLTQAVPSIDLDRRYWRADQTEFWGHVTSRCLPDTSGEKNGIVGVIIDITERKRMEEQVHQLAFYDPLTQLPNRRLLDDRLSQTLAAVKRSPRYGALMFLDLDNFKALNDTQGHAVGDLLLMELAVRLKSCVREMDTVARFGGDEFVVMISELGVEEPESTLQASSIAEKIRSALTAPYVLKVQRDGKTEKIVEHRCTASIGVALFGKHESNQEQILMQADRAMYQAKEAGSNLIRFYGSKT